MCKIGGSTHNHNTSTTSSNIVVGAATTVVVGVDATYLAEDQQRQAHEDDDDDEQMPTLSPEHGLWCCRYCDQVFGHERDAAYHETNECQYRQPRTTTTTTSSIHSPASSAGYHHRASLDPPDVTARPTYHQQHPPSSPHLTEPSSLPHEPQHHHHHHHARLVRDRGSPPTSLSSSPRLGSTPARMIPRTAPPPAPLDMLPQQQQQPPQHTPLSSPQQPQQQQGRCIVLGHTADCNRYALSPGDVATCTNVQLVEVSLSQVALQCAFCRGHTTLPRSVSGLAPCLRYLAREHLWRCDHAPSYARSVLWQAVVQQQQQQQQQHQSEDVFLQNLHRYCNVRARQLRLTDKYPGNAGVVFVAPTNSATSANASTTNARTPPRGPLLDHSGVSTTMAPAAAAASSDTTMTPTTTCPFPTPLQLPLPMPAYMGGMQHSASSSSSPGRSPQHGPSMVPINSPPVARPPPDDEQHWNRASSSSLMEPTMMFPTRHPTAPPTNPPPPPDHPPTMIVAPYGDSSSHFTDNNNFPFFQDASSGEWLCKFCQGMQFRDYGYKWPPNGGSSPTPPPADFIDHHLNCCRMHQQSILPPTNVVLPSPRTTTTTTTSATMSSSSSPPLVTPQPNYHYTAPHTSSSASGTRHSDGLHLVVPTTTTLDDNDPYRRAMAHLEMDNTTTDDDEYTIVKEDDRLLLTDFVYFLMRQFRKCQLTEADRVSRGRKRDEMESGYGGFQCRHCANLQTARKYYWTGVDRLSNSFAEVTNHALKCKASPAKTRHALAMLKERHKEQMSRLPRGSQKVYFRRMWKRIHPETMSTTDMDDSSHHTAR